MPHTPSAAAQPSAKRTTARLQPHLALATEANAAAYRRAVHAGASGECWDLVILTAANEKQAIGYRQELALRHRDAGPAGAFFPASQRSVVVADPPGKRAGSGGATLGVLAALARDHGVTPGDLARLRVLLIHSGGASQRLPAYSPLGKIFAPLPLLRPDGQIATLFDHLFLTLAGLPDRLGPGVLMLAGDVLLLFDHRDVATPPPGVTAISMRVDPSLALGHGVYVTDAAGGIRQTLQKVSADVMRQRGATDADGKVLIDTGLLFFDGAASSKLMGLAGVGKRGAASGLQNAFAGQIDLYEDVTAALASGTDRKAYLASPTTRPMRDALWKSLHGLPFQAMRVAGEFLHLGTTRQFRDAMIGRNPSPAAELFRADVLTHDEWNAAASGGRVYHGVLLADGAARGRLGAGAVVEHSMLGPRSQIGAGSVVSQTVAIERSLRLGDEQLFFQCPVLGEPARAANVTVGQVGRRALSRAKRGSVDASPRPLFVQVRCGVEDDFKGRFDRGACRYFNRPIDEWLEGHGISPDEIWADVPAAVRTLWTARLFVGTAERDRADAALPPADAHAPVPSRAIAAWRKAPRYSMAMLLELADADALIAQREVVAAHLQTEELLRSIRAGTDRPVDTVIARYATPAAYAHVEAMLQRWSAAPTEEAGHAIDQARAAWCNAQLLQRPDHPAASVAQMKSEQAMGRAFERVAFACEIGSRLGSGRSAGELGLTASPSESPSPVDVHQQTRSTPGPSGTDRFRVARSGSEGPGVGRSTGGRESTSRVPDARLGFERVRIDLTPGVEITATAPARLDLAGGWSDTPPYCFERGGHVVNVAIDLDGRPPLCAIVRTTAEPKLVLESRDLGRRVEVDRLPAGRPDMGDPFALHKVALGIADLLPPAGGDVAAHLRSLGAGLHVITESRLPKGSGLGTSSILAAALVAALLKLRPGRHSVAELIERTSLVEQRLSTGGGWQDQVGGIVGGVKSTVTTPGVPQRPAIEPLDLDAARHAALEERLVVYYSGRQRLARDILRRVMGRWLAREPAAVQLMDALKRSAAALRVALLRGRWSAAAAEMAAYWQIKRDLYPGSSTPAIDLLFWEMRDDCLAAGLAGAGGGGFAYFLCRDARQAARLRARLAEHAARPGSLGDVYAARINRRGLVVTSRRLR